MLRVSLSLSIVLALVAGCDNTRSKVEAAADKAGQAVDKLERDEAAGHLAAARAAVASGGEPAEACTYAASHPAATELVRVCDVELPLARATKAVVAAETARAEQPEAPTLTECQSDAWAKAKARLDRALAGDAGWTALGARWAKACPGL